MKTGGHRSKQGTENRAENCSQCAGKHSKKKSKAASVYGWNVNWTMEWKNTIIDSKAFICRGGPYSVLSSSSWTSACLCWPREGAEDILELCDGPEDCRSLHDAQIMHSKRTMFLSLLFHQLTLPTAERIVQRQSPGMFCWNNAGDAQS